MVRIRDDLGDLGHVTANRPVFQGVSGDQVRREAITEPGHLGHLERSDGPDGQDVCMGDGLAMWVHVGSPCCGIWGLCHHALLPIC